MREKTIWNIFKKMKVGTSKRDWVEQVQLVHLISIEHIFWSPAAPLGVAQSVVSRHFCKDCVYKSLIMKEVLGLQICQHLYKSNEVCLRFCILWPTGSCFIFKRGSVSGFNQRQLTDRLTGSPKFKPSHWLLHVCFIPIVSM